MVATQVFNQNLVNGNIRNGLAITTSAQPGLIQIRFFNLSTSWLKTDVNQIFLAKHKSVNRHGYISVR